MRSRHIVKKKIKDKWKYWNGVRFTEKPEDKFIFRYEVEADIIANLNRAKKVKIKT